MSAPQLSSARLRTAFWLSLIIKLALAVFIPLTNDETYYWVWSQHMQWSFYDHPPVVAWLFWLGQQINWYGGMVRWPGVLLGQCTLALWLVILRPVLNAEQRFYWLLLALLSPLVGGTNLLVTPDLPLLFFNALSLWVFYQWREKPHWLWSLALGFAVGLGFSSKYMMVLFPLSLFPLIVAGKATRMPFFRQLGWMILGVVAGTLPVWLWNILNDFASLRFQVEHGLGREIWKPSWTIEYVLAQIGLIFPPLLYWVFQARRRVPMVYHLLAWVPLIFFLFTTARGYVEANWPIAAYPALFVLVAASWPRNGRAIQITLAIWALLFGALATVILSRPEWSRGMKFKEFYQFESVLAAAKDFAPLFARSYQMAAKMNFELKRPVYKLRGMTRKDFYDFLPESEPHGQAFFVAVERGDELPLAYGSAGYKITETIKVDERFEIWRVVRQ